MPHERGHDAQKPEVFLQRDLFPEEAIHAQDPQGGAVQYNGDADKGDLLLVEMPGPGLIEEDGLLAHDRHDEWLGGPQNQPGNPLPRPAIGPRLALRDEVPGGPAAQFAGFGVLQGDPGIFQGQGLGQRPEDKLQGLIQILGLAENLANFKDDLVSGVL